MIDVLVMILAGGRGERLYPLTRDRAKPAVPFGGRYRIIDFVLSNFINSGFFRIKVLTQYRSNSLLIHLARGFNFGSLAEHYVDAIPAHQGVGDLGWYAGTADAIYQNLSIVQDERPQDVAIFGGDHIYKMDVRQMMDFHREHHSGCTVAAPQAGDTEKATQAVTRVLALAPDHPVAAELAAQLNSKFQGRAEDALRQMKSASEAAQRANASSLREYGAAGQLARQAEEAFGQKKFTEATQKALDAKKTFDIARANAVALASAKPATPVAGAPPASGGATIAPPPPTIAQPIVPATGPVVTTPVTLPAANDDAEVRRLISEFARAIEEKDVALYKTLRPKLSSADERNLKTAFQNVRSQTVTLNIDSIKVEGTTAVVRVTRAGKVNGEQIPLTKQVFRLAKGPAGWTIQDIGQ